MPVTCADIINIMEDIAPLSLAEKWDNPGLLLGEPAQEVSRVLLALDVTPPVVAEATKIGAQLIVAHHPVIFRPLKALRTDDVRGRMLAALLRQGIAVLAAHTNLDAAAGGVNDVLAAALGLTDVAILAETEEPLVKIAVYVPEEYVDHVRTAMTDAGAGHIGGYSDCTFSTPGTGTFKPLAGARPFIGQEGELTHTAECRLETIVPQTLVAPVVAAMRRVHPYEEVAYDLYPLLNRRETAGMGRIGRLAAPLTLDALARLVARVLAVPAVKVAGQADAVRRVAVCGGSGSGLAARAAKLRADVLVTGDVGYHDAQDAVAMGLAVIDAGHFGTEHPVLAALAAVLSARAQTAGWTVDFHVSRQQHDIFRIIQG